jgi:hypothetical protein
VSQLKYFRTLANRNLIEEEIKRKLSSGNAYYHSVQSLMSFPLLSKDVKIRIYKTVIFPMLLHGCANWYRALKEEYRVRMFEG